MKTEGKLTPPTPVEGDFLSGEVMGRVLETLGSFLDGPVGSEHWP